MLVGHGDDAYLYHHKIKFNFSSNVYYNGFPEGLKEHLISSIESINTYPEVNANSLQEKLAQWHQIPSSNLIVTNGATEAFYLIAQSLQFKTVTIVIPSFAEYEDACISGHTTINYLPWNELNLETRFNTPCVFIGNPNNPTGAIIEKNNLIKIIENNPQTIFIVDEAYVDFTIQTISLVDSHYLFPNLIIVKSLTKTYAIPGLRLGYIISNSYLIQQLSKSKMPWSVNSMAIAAGTYIVDRCTHYKLPLVKLLHDTKHLIQEFENTLKLNVVATNTNFFLCQTPHKTASELKLFLIENYGILIRDASNFKGLSPKHFRIATQSKDKNELLVKGIQNWINKS